jgi:glycine cleavage system aminomethyltransferase T
MLPFDPSTMIYVKFGPFIVPRESAGWEEETTSWKNTCSIHIGLTLLMSQYHLRIKGPEAERLLSENSLRDFSTMKAGRIRHTIFCSELGNIMGHGLVLCHGKNDFETMIAGNTPHYHVASGKYNVEPYVPNPPFIYQIGGPTSLQTLEHACQEDLHDIGFMRFREASIARHRIRVLRIGMSGTLAYEVHGNWNDGPDVYNAILAAGQPFGIVRMGEMYLSYLCQHTENGFPQANSPHFTLAYREDREFYEWYRANIFPEHPGVYSAWDPGNDAGDMRGTLGDNIHDYYYNPIELGWGHSIDWNHEFVGKAALKKIAEGTPRKPVTLDWNAEDVLDVYASYLHDKGEPYMFMPFPRGDEEHGNFQLKVVDKKGKAVGASMGRTYSLYQRKTISLGVLDAGAAELGDEVVVLWGDRDKHPIKKIRAKVSKFPSLDMVRNEEYDIESIPHFRKQGT